MQTVGPGDHPSTQTGPRTLLVVGPPRSGTTLLARLLACDGERLSLSELHLARAIMPHWKLQRVFGRVARSARLQRRHPPLHCDDRGFLEYMRRLARDSGYDALVLKETYREGLTPLWSNGHQLDELLPRVHASLALLRHPADVAASSIGLLRPMIGIVGRLVRLRWRVLPHFRNRDAVVDWAAQNWVMYVDWLARQRLRPLLYEDFVAAPQMEWERIVAHFGLPESARRLDESASRRAFGGVGDPGVMRRPRAIDRRAVGRGAGLSAAQRARVRAVCGAAAERFGYAW